MSVSSALIGLFLCCSTCDEILRILGFDWLLLFLQGHIHRLTVVLAMRTLLLMLGSPPVLARFREGSTSGGWLDETQSVLENRIGIALGLSTLVSTRLPSGSLSLHLFSPAHILLFLCLLCCCFLFLPSSSFSYICLPLSPCPSSSHPSYLISLPFLPSSPVFIPTFITNIWGMGFSIAASTVHTTRLQVS